MTSVLTQGIYKATNDYLNDTTSKIKKNENKINISKTAEFCHQEDVLTPYVPLISEYNNCLYHYGLIHEISK